MHEKAVEVTEWPEDSGNETIAGWLGCLFLAHRKPIHNSSIKLKSQPLETTNWTFDQQSICQSRLIAVKEAKRVGNRGTEWMFQG